MDSRGRRSCMSGLMGPPLQEVPKRSLGGEVAFPSATWERGEVQFGNENIKREYKGAFRRRSCGNEDKGWQGVQRNTGREPVPFRKGDPPGRPCENGREGVTYGPPPPGRLKPAAARKTRGRTHGSAFGRAMGPACSTPTLWELATDHWPLFFSKRACLSFLICYHLLVKHRGRERS